MLSSINLVETEKEATLMLLYVYVTIFFTTENKNASHVCNLAKLCQVNQKKTKYFKDSRPVIVIQNFTAHKKPLTVSNNNSGIMNSLSLIQSA